MKTKDFLDGIHLKKGGDTEDPFFMLAYVIGAMLGWGFVVNETEEELIGMSIGTSQYIKMVEAREYAYKAIVLSSGVGGKTFKAVFAQMLAAPKELKKKIDKNFAKLVDV